MEFILISGRLLRWLGVGRRMEAVTVGWHWAVMESWAGRRWATWEEKKEKKRGNGNRPSWAPCGKNMRIQPMVGLEYRKYFSISKLLTKKQIHLNTNEV
jgi:hypothetical protein